MIEDIYIKCTQEEISRKKKRTRNANVKTMKCRINSDPAPGPNTIWESHGEDEEEGSVFRG